MKKRFLLPIMIAVIMLLGLSACHPALSLKDVEKQNRNKWCVTYDLQGGAFSSLEGVEILHYYPKSDEGTLIIDPQSSSNPFGALSVSRAGYQFEGWYPNKDFVYAERWNFKEDKIHGNTTLYAHWLESFVFTFMYQEEEGGEWKELSSRTVQQGGRLRDSNKPTRDGYTMLDWYDNEDCSTFWNTETPHAGTVVEGAVQNRVVKVYTTWIEGDWAIVRTASDLTQALLNDRNVYLYNDIEDFDEVQNGTNWNALDAEYSGTFEGNGHAVRGVEISFPDASGSVSGDNAMYGALFARLMSGAKLQHVSFEDITLTVAPDGLDRWAKYCGLLAGIIEAGVTFEDVTLTGSITVTYRNSFNRGFIGKVSGDIKTGASLAGLTYTVSVTDGYTGSGKSSYTENEVGELTFTVTESSGEEN